MKPDQNDTPRNERSRRTGIDRRWINTPDYYPERRSGVDRRGPQEPGTRDSMDGKRQQKRPGLFPTLDSDT